MKRIRLIGLLGVMLFLTAPARAGGNSSLTDESLAKIDFEQKVDGQVSLNLEFRDEQGKTVRLGDYFGTKPVILDLGYYSCPMLCTLVLNGMVESLQDLKLDIGNQFEVINVSIDPTETPELAVAKKQTYLKRYGRSNAGAGWHFLTGDAAATQQLADEVGFHYAYDPRIKQYAHPSGIIVLTPQGKVARYFFGVNFAPGELNTALNDAGAGRKGSRVEQFAMLCFHYSPLKGKYGNLIMDIMRVGGTVTVVVVIGILVFGNRRQRKREAIS